MWPKKLLELSLLLLQMLGLGLLIIPGHTSTYWWEPEATGWVIPLANRLGSGPALYSDGAHGPLPPLSYILAYLLTGGQGVWWHESLLNYLCQCLTILVMFAVLVRLCGRLTAYVACSASLAVFIALPKSILYDSMAQMWVAVATLLALEVTRRPDRRIWPFLLGGVLGLLIMTKQSTAVGAIAGSSLFLIRRRGIGDVLALCSGTMATTLLALLALSPWVDPRGFFYDTLVTGSDPKGGLSAALARLGIFGLQLLAHGSIVLVLGLAFLCWQGPKVGCLSDFRPDDSGLRAGLLIWPLALALGMVGLFTQWRYGLPSITAYWMWPALVFYLACVARAGTDSQRAVAVVTFSSAVGHSLSVPDFRFFYDNNPLLVLVLAHLVEQFFKAPADWFRWRWWGVPVVPVTPVVILLIGAWLHATPNLHMLGQAKIQAQDIPHLAGAKLPERADGLLAMVREVRARTSPTDRVLLLPEDPNLVPWFDRRRPNLTSSVLFFDTYWDRFVDEDLRRLQDDAPEVIIIGPHLQWAQFATWIKQNPEALEEDVARLIEELKPRLSDRYEAPVEFKVKKLDPSGVMIPNEPSTEDSFSVYYLKK